jgi:uncharacterized protein YndB with AHSA1/START domain
MAHYSIKHLFHINAPRKKVFDALTTIDGLSGWWTTQTAGASGIGDSIQFRFGEHGGPDMQVKAITPGESVTWECTSSPHGWVGHTLTFNLDENEGKTRVRFSHDGWNVQDDSYAATNFSWARYMESLRQFCQTGTGEAFGSESYRR